MFLHYFCAVHLGLEHSPEHFSGNYVYLLKWSWPELLSSFFLSLQLYSHLISLSSHIILVTLALFQQAYFKLVVKEGY